MKKTLVFLISLLFLLTPPKVLAQEQTSIIPDLNNFTTTVVAPASSDNFGDIQGIDDSAKKVLVTFPDVPENARVCLRGDLCVGNSNLLMEIRDAIASNAPEKLNKLLQNGIPEGSLKTDLLLPLQSGTITVCGDGEINLKTKCDPESSVWFHAGHAYFATVYEKQEGGSDWMITRRAIIYINHHTPIVKVSPVNNKAPEKFKIELSQDSYSKDGKEKSNNFQIVMEGNGYKQEVCIPNEKTGGFRKDTTTNPYVIEMPFKDPEHTGNGLLPGKYVIKISEQVNEGGIRNDKCQGGFTYLKFECSVLNDSKPTPECKRTEDPNGSDTRNIQKLLDEIGKESSSIIPCEDGKANQGLLECESLDTSIGSIPLNPVGFITRLFQIVLAFAGLGAMLLIIYAGYRLLLSRGDKEIIQAQRDRITSAIVGLLFIIFSLVLLSVIAGDILKIPGFNDNPLPGQTKTK